VNDGNTEPAPSPPEADDLARPLRVAPGRDRIEEWALVLAATGIDHQIARATDGNYLLFVPDPERPRAARTLELYDEESRLAARRAPDAPERGGVGLGIVVGLALIAFAYRTGFWETGGTSRWFELGVADATRIRTGDWWRTVTAMTLHGDLMHLLGNVAASVIFMGAAGRWLGSGVAAMLIVVAGAAANLLTAWTERPEHLSRLTTALRVPDVITNVLTRISPVTALVELYLLPAYIVVFFLWLFGLLVSIVAWFAILITGRFPATLFELIELPYRYSIRLQSFGNLVTDRYPWFQPESEQGNVPSPEWDQPL